MSELEMGSKEREESAKLLSGVEVLALYRELSSTYSRLYAMARGQDYEQVAREAERTRALVERLQQASQRQGADALVTGSSDRLDQLWSETVEAVRQIVDLRELVLESLDGAVSETKAALTTLGRGQAALSAYRSPTPHPPRVRSCRI